MVASRSCCPLPFTDLDRLHKIAHSDTLPWYQVRRARIVLAIAAGERQCAVAARLECDEATVWRTCQRYRQEGLRVCSPMAVKAIRDD